MRYNKDAATDLIAAGQYAASVKTAKEKVSKQGNEMIELILTVYGPNGSQVDVFDYLLSTDAMQFKVKHFCESAGLDYERGELQATDCENKSVKVNLEIKKQEGYADKNNVKDYLPRATPVTVTATEANDDDIPF